MAIDIYGNNGRGPLPQPKQLPGVLQHLVRLSDSFDHDIGNVSYLHVYARPRRPGATTRLEFIAAAESGPEGIACVDDAARAVLLACAVYDEQHDLAVRQLARQWLDFVVYMHEPDGRFTNFILDDAGHKNRRGRTSYPGGQWWTARAHWALASGWRVTGDRRYLHALQQGRLAGTANLKVTAVQALALMELYRSQPSDELCYRICALCDRIIAAGSGYFRDRKDRDEVMPWGYHQLQAVARAGRLFSRIDYLAACEQTVTRVIVPLIAARFEEVAPWEHAPRCAYDISSLVLGLEELYRATHRRIYRTQALTCADWLYGHNPSGEALYNPHTGCCFDGLNGNTISLHCGAESAIEAGLVELARRRLQAR
jgi:hypothetical protein